MREGLAESRWLLRTGVRSVIEWPLELLFRAAMQGAVGKCRASRRYQGDGIEIR
ncbi:hypothetical protein [Gorillibacterium massiliense]|uniref:hypothetical protein n=1 Tax=Gorillibacterium massiliense TaxID=1280390 RepID=UPI0004BA8729|nr:hypothetical protein [Gorillibacterium massiliense]